MAGVRFPVDAAATLVRVALEEDLGQEHRDVTTFATIPGDQVGTASVVARADGVLAGSPVIELVLREVAELLAVPVPSVEPVVADGSRVTTDDIIAELRGPVRAVLVGERTLLNILCRLSGVATHTRRWADALEGTGAQVLDTRKTTPGMRELEKYAVRVGGGTNKRMGLHDVAMIKDNHTVAAGSVRAAFDAVRTAYPGVRVEVEVTTIAEALEAYAAGARFLLCDNMGVDLLGETVRVLRAMDETVKIEATGGLTLERAREYALTGVDYLSVGGLTHSSPILDIAVDLEPGTAPARAVDLEPGSRGDRPDV